MKAFVILKPDVRDDEAVDILGRLEQIGTVEQNDFRILSNDMVEKLYPEHVNEWYWERHLEFMTSGPCHLIALDIGDDDTRMQLFKLDIRKGTTNPRNKIHLSEHAEDDIELFWSVHV